MPKRISNKTKDANVAAFQILDQATSEELGIDRETLSKVMAEMGRKGGKIGGKRSLDTMTAKKRKERAQKAAKARWKKHDK
jgi:hypothetical protein